MEPIHIGQGVSHFAVSNSFRPHRLQPTRLFFPWDSPGKNTEVGCHFLLQGNLGLLHCRQILYFLSHQGSPKVTTLGSSSQKVFGALGDEWGSMKSSSAQCIPVLLKLESAWSCLKILFKYTVWFRWSEQDPAFSIFNLLPGDANAAGPRITFWAGTYSCCL